MQELLEDTWPIRTRPIRGRELRLELGMTAVFLLAAAMLATAGDMTVDAPAVVAAVVVAYALAARVEFPIGTGFFIPTQLFLVPLFVVAPAQVVPLLVFAAFGLAAAGAAAAGAAKLDRVVFCAGDACHALGPAIVITAFASGDVTQAGLAVLVAAFLAQLVADFASSSFHELLSMRARPQVHLRVMLQTWGVDLALGTVGVLAALQALETPWAALAPMALLVLLRALAADRVRKIGAAHERLVALELERGRRRTATQLLERQVEFLQDVSHELRTPVTIARGHLENLRRAHGNSPESAVVLDELERIERIVERLLVLARSDQPETFSAQELDADAFLEDLFVRWSDTVPRPWQLGDVAAGTLIADCDALRAALDALIENAVKHTTLAQQVRLSSHIDARGLVIEVADTGGGIPAEELHQIFDRFTRAAADRDARIGGVGLGLATVDAVAKAHGGGCSVESSPEGSTFALWLPGFEPQAPAAAQRAAGETIALAQY